MVAGSASSRRTRTLAVVAAVLVVVVVSVVWAAHSSSDGSTTTTPHTTTTLTKGCTAPAGVAVVTAERLPAEARTTLGEIAAGPPYRFQRDGVVFQNRERLLPRQASGYYREFTVVTPGSNDRGARRIIVGDCGDRWYTDDHYVTFRLIEGE
jgi:ribonuclease T1